MNIRWLLVAMLLLAVLAVAVLSLAGSEEKDIRDYRLDQLEIATQRMQRSHDELMLILLGNLGATLGSIVTFLVTHRRNNRP